MSDQSAAGDFDTFYREHFLGEHRHPGNIALHVFGTITGLLCLVAGLTFVPLWWALLWIPLNIVPGLIGHRLFERNEAVGDVRLTRTDFPKSWFLLGNHLMAARLIGSVLTFGLVRAR